MRSIVSSSRSKATVETPGPPITLTTRSPRSSGTRLSTTAISNLCRAAICRAWAAEPAGIPLPPPPESARRRRNRSSSSPITSKMDALTTTEPLPLTLLLETSEVKYTFPTAPLYDPPCLEHLPPRRYHMQATGKPHALVAQPDRASDYESEGRRFESCRARFQKPAKPKKTKVLGGGTRGF